MIITNSIKKVLLYPLLAIILLFILSCRHNKKITKLELQLLDSNSVVKTIKDGEEYINSIEYTSYTTSVILLKCIAFKSDNTTDTITPKWIISTPFCKDFMDIEICKNSKNEAYAIADNDCLIIKTDCLDILGNYEIRAVYDKAVSSYKFSVEPKENISLESHLQYNPNANIKNTTPLNLGDMRNISKELKLGINRPLYIGLNDDKNNFGALVWKLPKGIKAISNLKVYEDEVTTDSKTLGLYILADKKIDNEAKITVQAGDGGKNKEKEFTLKVTDVSLKTNNNRPDYTIEKIDGGILFSVKPPSGKEDTSSLSIENPKDCQHSIYFNNGLWYAQIKSGGTFNINLFDGKGEEADWLNYFTYSITVPFAPEVKTLNYIVQNIYNSKEEMRNALIYDFENFYKQKAFATITINYTPDEDLKNNSGYIEIYDEKNLFTSTFDISKEKNILKELDYNYPEKIYARYKDLKGYANTDFKKVFDLNFPNISPQLSLCPSNGVTTSIDKSAYYIKSSLNDNLLSMIDDLEVWIQYKNNENCSWKAIRIDKTLNNIWQSGFGINIPSENGNDLMLNTNSSEDKIRVKIIAPLMPSFIQNGEFTTSEALLSPQPTINLGESYQTSYNKKTAYLTPAKNEGTKYYLITTKDNINYNEITNKELYPNNEWKEIKEGYFTLIEYPQNNEGSYKAWIKSETKGYITSYSSYSFMFNKAPEPILSCADSTFSRRFKFKVPNLIKDGVINYMGRFCDISIKHYTEVPITISKKECTTKEVDDFRAMDWGAGSFGCAGYDMYAYLRIKGYIDSDVVRAH